MQEETNQKTHLSQTAVFRAGLLLIFIVLIFGILRQLAIPKSFGQYGYYRGDNIGEWVSRDQNYALGNKTCVPCHAQEVNQTAQAEHGQIDCQSCHGPLESHVRKPSESHPKIAGTAELCGACHRELLGRSKELVPTVKVGEHSGGLDCTRCHNPHEPWAKIGGRKS